MKWLLFALVACKASEESAPKPPPPAPVDDAAYADKRAAISEAWLAMRELRNTAEGELVFPDGPLPALDFREGGNAILTMDEHLDREPLGNEARFRIVHLSDDMWRIARLDPESPFEHDRANATLYAPRRDAVKRRIAAAKYVLFVRGVGKPAELDLGNMKLLEPARFDGVALLYALSPAKLLAGIPLRVTSDPAQQLDKQAARIVEMDKAMLSLEARARDVLWDALRKRARSLEVPSFVYMGASD